MFDFVCRICERKFDVGEVTNLVVNDLFTSHYTILNHVCRECNAAYQEERKKAIEKIEEIDEQIKVLTEERRKTESCILDKVKKRYWSPWKKLMNCLNGE